LLKNYDKTSTSGGSLGWLTGLFSQFSGDWWVEITTQEPKCVYYFGPFASVEDADQSQTGYLEDLAQEGAKGVAVVVKRCKPKQLTITDELELSSSY
jgi:hypothetical protein